MKNFKLIGLTGRTGSGKSVVREFFEENGYKVIDADTLARSAIENRIVKGDILAAFGVDLLKDGEIDRKELAKRAFSGSAGVNTLNAIMHPMIVFIFLGQLRELVDNGETKILFDAPQLFEAKLDTICDYIIAVAAEDSLRIERIMKRDNISRKMAEQRLSVQLSDSFFRENSDFYLENNNSEIELKTNLEKLLSQI